ncbi:MAG: hypothetical protein EXQ58_04635 [Acidobacteria bacterium]|nr:hypothetical protein [Acidobacteriota bacterium]
MAAGPEGFRLWQKNRERTEEGMLAGAPFHNLESEPGQYDGLLDFRLQHGVWAAGTEMRYAESKTDNGIAFDVLNGLECLRERAGLETPAHGGPLLKGADWMERLGFTAEQYYGVDCVSRVRNEKREIHQFIQRGIGQPQRVWSQPWEEREFSGRKQNQQGLTTVLPSQLLVSDRTERTIEVNRVVTQQRHGDGSLIRDKKGKDISWTT